MKNLILIFLVLSSSLKAQDQNPLPNPVHNTIQLALLLDVSSSMSGLITQAKTELWTIVNEVSKSKKNNHNTKLEIALYEYGRSSNPVKDGYIVKLLDYTSDLDTISEVLFSLSINGGDEYCGTVIDKALNELQWINNDSVYRVIFIAGNEPFNQGKVDYKNAGEHAAQKGITINTIHCGDSLEGVIGFWLSGAKIGKGEYFYINHNSNSHDIPTPFDSMMVVYSDSMNTTYWNYGISGAHYKSNQMKQDKNAGSYSKSVNAKRAVTKTKSVYNNKKWDVLDASKSDTTFLSKTAESDLPEVLKGKSLQDKKIAVDSVSAKRNYFSKKINELEVQRQKYISEHKPIENSHNKTLGQALVEAIHRQAGLKGFIFDE